MLWTVEEQLLSVVNFRSIIDSRTLTTCFMSLLLLFLNDTLCVNFLKVLREMYA